MTNKRKGFTLVELLIVIVVIGILSAMMMLSSTEAVSSAKANNVISNLRNLKTALISWYVDNIDRVQPNGTDKGHTKYKITNVDGTGGQSLTEFVKTDDGNKELLRYLNNENAINLKSDKSSPKNDGDYYIKDVNWERWYVWYQVGSDTRVKEKLASRAKSLGLVGVDKIDTDLKDNSDNTYTNQKYEGMFVLNLGK